MDQTYNILAIVILGLILELIIAHKLRSDKKRLERIDEEFKKEFEHIKQQLGKIISSTREESLEVVSKTLEQYDDVHSQLQNFTLKLNQRIDEVTEEIVAQQKELLKQHAQKSSQELTASTKAEIEKLSSLLQETITSTQAKVSQELTAQTKKTQGEIEEFKKAQLEMLAQKSEQLIGKVAQKYLNKNLSANEKHNITLQLIDELWQNNQEKETND